MMKRPKGERYLTAELKCYCCGHVAGHVIGPVASPLAHGRFRPVGAADTAWEPIEPGRHLRCPRCAGRILLDDVEYDRVRPGVTMPWQQPAPVPSQDAAADSRDRRHHAA